VSIEGGFRGGGWRLHGCREQQRTSRCRTAVTRTKSPARTVGDIEGLSPDGLLPETVEYPDHPWFIGVQYHPELKSRPFEPHPLFKGFIAAAIEQSRLV
jgi:CTP synthase (UTP-ammonia lyase)